MDALHRSLAELEDRLHGAGLDTALIGGVAVAVWGEPRLTRNVDVKVAVGRDGVGALMDALGPGYSPVFDDPFQTASAMGIVFVQDAYGTRIDLLLADLAFDRVAIDRAREVDLGSGVAAQVCSPEDLVIYKLLSTRPRDHADAQAVVRRQGDRLDHAYVVGWLEQFEAALDDSALVSTYRAMRR